MDVGVPELNQKRWILINPEAPDEIYDPRRVPASGATNYVVGCIAMVMELLFYKQTINSNRFNHNKKTLKM